MNDIDVDSNHRVLIDTAAEVLRKNGHPVKHSVGAAVLCASGRIYSGVNLESSGHGVCAEPIALGAALSNGEREILAVVAVCDHEGVYTVLSPCGNCRQMLLDYAPEADVIYRDSNGAVARSKARELLPGAYTVPDFTDV